MYLLPLLQEILLDVLLAFRLTGQSLIDAGDRTFIAVAVPEKDGHDTLVMLVEHDD